MIHEENKNHQPEKEDFSIENFLTDEKKQPLMKQQGITHREDFAKPEVDEEAIMRVMAGEEPEEIATETEHSKPLVNNSKKGTSKMELQLKIGDFFYAAIFSFSNSISSICLGVL